MNEISARRLAGFLVLAIAIVVGTLLFAVTVSGPTVPGDSPQQPSASATMAVPAPSDEEPVVLPSLLPKPVPSLPSPLPAH